MSLITHFKYFNKINFNKFLTFKIADFNIGYVYKPLAVKISSWFSNNFDINSESLILYKLQNKVINFNNLTEFFNKIAVKLLSEKIIPQITQEYFKVTPLNSDKELFKIERTLLPLFAIRARGIHLNAYVVKNNHIYIWIAKRSKSKLLYPGKLDNLVAGAISYGYNAFNTVIKESFEEASISKDLVKNAILTQTLHYLYPYKNGIRNDTMYIYNLELPLDFIPKQNDGEVEEFFLIEASEVLDLMNSNSNNFKFNSAIAIISFLVNKQLINKKNTHYKSITAINKALKKLTS